MLVRNIKSKKLTYQKKIICFDYGKKIGVAISDENHKIFQCV